MLPAQKLQSASTRHNFLIWGLCTLLLILLTYWTAHSHSSHGPTEQFTGLSSSQACPPPTCLDVLVVYHKDDQRMMVQNGGLQAAMTHLKGVRKFFILSLSNQTFSHLLGPRVAWIDETRAPFTRANFRGFKRPEGWLFQQALKWWAVKEVPELCNDVMVLDSDILWLRDFDVRAPPLETRVDGELVSACRTPQRYKYCLSSMDSGAWYGDITNPEYQHFVNWFLGMPKVLANTHTGINNWQVMQRDVVARIEGSLVDRGFKNTTDALVSYARSFNGMSEYEAYFSYVWSHHRERVEPVYLPWVLRKPQLCDFNNKAMMAEYQEHSVLAYFTCHDNYGDQDYYINCKGRETQCDTKLSPRMAV